ncbi:MAG: hypothetical protein ACI4OW_04510 [Alphaproteobacteria bacterium]
MSDKTNKSLIYGLLCLAVAGCNWQNRSFGDIIRHPFASDKTYVQAKIQNPGSVVVCRSKQCAPAKLSMSKEYIYNSLLQLLNNNNHQKLLVCEADAYTHACLENFITMPVKVGITPAYAYIDSAKITDVNVKRNNTLNVILNYNLTYNGQSPECFPSNALVYVKDVNNIIMEDGGYTCKMTTIGQTNVKTLFTIDYIDLDYGYIGGYYSIGLSGPAFGGGSGYMILRFPKDAYPLSPVLKAKSMPKALNNAQQYLDEALPQKVEEITETINTDVQIFPIKK